MFVSACVGMVSVFPLSDDEILDVNGVTITGMTVAEVGQAIRNCPGEFLATVRPLTALKKLRPPDVIRVNYVTVLPNLLSQDNPKADSPGAQMTSSDSFDDVGNYDDEDEESNSEVETADSLLQPAPLTGKSRSNLNPL